MSHHEIYASMDERANQVLGGLASGVNLVGAAVSTELMGMILHLLFAAIAPVVIAAAGAFAKSYAESRSTLAAKLEAGEMARVVLQDQIDKLQVSQERIDQLTADLAAYRAKAPAMVEKASEKGAERGARAALSDSNAELLVRPPAKESDGS